jgi:predicted  nucleic acid-binding Zn-ribbon protein
VSSNEDELFTLRAEVERLRALVGPSEESYDKLRLDLWAARDHAQGAEAETGQLRGRVRALEAELTRAMQDKANFHKLVYGHLRKYSGAVRRKLRNRMPI